MEPLTAALALATEQGDIDKLRDIASMATALQTGARNRGLGIEAENQAAEVIIRAERAIGRELIRMAETGERVVKGQGRFMGSKPGRESVWSETSPDQMTLPQLGLDTKQASNFQALARIPDDVFESKFATLKAVSEQDKSQRLAKVDFYRLVKDKAEKPVTDTAVHGEGFTPVVANFLKAGNALAIHMAQVPDNELVEVAHTVRSVAEAYNAAKNARA